MESASLHEQRERDAAIARAMSRPESDPNFDGRHCVEEDCGDAIPEGRLALGKIRCITCQQAKEKRRA